MPFLCLEVRITSSFGQTASISLLRSPNHVLIRTQRSNIFLLRSPNHVLIRTDRVNFFARKFESRPHSDRPMPFLCLEVRITSSFGQTYALSLLRSPNYAPIRTDHVNFFAQKSESRPHSDTTKQFFCSQVLITFPFGQTEAIFLLRSPNHALIRTDLCPFFA
jgi:hypothetical protein